MIMDGFKIIDIMQAFKCTRRQIEWAANHHFGSSVMYIRMIYKIEVMK